MDRHIEFKKEKFIFYWQTKYVSSFILYFIFLFVWRLRLKTLQGSHVSPAVTAPVTESATDRRWTEPAGQGRTPASPPTSWPSTSPPWRPSLVSSPGRPSSWSRTASVRAAAVCPSVSLQSAVSGSARGKFASELYLYYLNIIISIYPTAGPAVPGPTVTKVSPGWRRICRRQAWPADQPSQSGPPGDVSS